MERARTALRWILGAAMITVGVLHFAAEPFFTSIVPPWVPAPKLMVWLSGVAEMALGAGILLPRTRRLSSLGLVALYLAVFPANIHMAVNGVTPAGVSAPVPAWAAWGRLPLQALLIAWALWVGRPRAGEGGGGGEARRAAS